MFVVRLNDLIGCRTTRFVRVTDLRPQLTILGDAKNPRPSQNNFMSGQRSVFTELTNPLMNGINTFVAEADRGKSVLSATSTKCNAIGETDRRLHQTLRFKVKSRAASVLYLRL